MKTSVISFVFCIVLGGDYFPTLIAQEYPINVTMPREDPAIVDKYSWVRCPSRFLPPNAVVALVRSDAPFYYVGRAAYIDGLLPALVLWDNDGAVVKHDSDVYPVKDYELLLSNHTILRNIEGIKLPHRSLKIGMNCKGGLIYIGFDPKMDQNIAIQKADNDNLLVCTPFSDGEDRLCTNEDQVLCIK